MNVHPARCAGPGAFARYQLQTAIRGKACHSGRSLNRRRPPNASNLPPNEQTERAGAGLYGTASKLVTIFATAAKAAWTGPRANAHHHHAGSIDENVNYLDTSFNDRASVFVDCCMKLAHI
jgi:hypothetical protein